MLLSVINYLNNGSFVKNVDLKNLENCVEAASQVESLFQDSDQKVSADIDPYLGFDCIGRCSMKGFDSQMLLYPAEKEFNLPVLLVNIGDGFCRNGKYWPNIRNVCSFPSPRKTPGVASLGRRFGIS